MDTFAHLKFEKNDTSSSEDHQDFFELHLSENGKVPFIDLLSRDCVVVDRGFILQLCA
jgi:hypothetical protein